MESPAKLTLSSGSWGQRLLKGAKLVLLSDFLSPPNRSGDASGGPERAVPALFTLSFLAFGIVKRLVLYMTLKWSKVSVLGGPCRPE